MSKPLFSKKSTLRSRRNIIIYIIATILILGIVAGFTNVFHSDNRRFAAEWGETIVMESKPPESGTPSDFDLLTNLKYTAYRIHHAKYFKGYTDGKVSADITVGNYTQYLTNTRVVYNQNVVFTETISSSSLKSLAEQKYIDNGVIIFRGADQISGSKATFSSKASQMSYEQYSKNYGAVPNQLSKYIINEKTILSVKDENALKAATLNSDGSDGVSFDVPERLVPNADGNYVFTLTLDPTASSLYYRNEVRTLGGADQNPKFYSVKITVTVNSNWIPISTRTLEEYDIAIPVLGAMRCSGDNLEIFTMIDDENGTIPEKDFFQPYVDQAKANPDYKPPEINQSGPLSASDYLAAAFEGYLSGKQNLDLAATVNIDGIPVLGNLSAYSLNLLVNLDTMDVQAMLGSDLYVKYAGDKVYIKNNDINGYISTAAAKKLTDDPILGGLLAFGELDMNKIFGGDMLDVIFKDCEMTEADGITNIPMSFSLDLSDIIPALDEVKVVASIKINSESKTLDSIIGTVYFGDIAVNIEATPLDTPPSFPTVNGTNDLSGLLDFVPDIAATALQDTYGIDGTLTLNGMTVGLCAYVDRTDGLTAEATLTVGGMEVLVKYLGETVYVNALGVNVVGTIDELPELMDALLDVTGFGKYQKLFKAMLPSSINQIVDMLDSMAVNGNTLDLGFNFIGMPIDISLTREGGRLQSVALGMNVNLFGIKADIAADLNISEPTKREVTAPTSDSALTFADLATLIRQAKPYLDAEYFTVNIDGRAQINGTQGAVSGSLAIDKLTDKNKNTFDITAAGSLSAFGQDVTVAYVDGTAYVEINNIKAKLDTADNSLIPSLMQLVELVAGNYEMPQIDFAVSDLAVNSASMTDGTLSLALSAKGCDVTASIDLQSGKIGIVVATDGISAELDITVAISKTSGAISAPDDASEYMDIAALSALADTAARIIEAGGIHTVASVAMGELTLNAAVDCTVEDGMLKAVVREDSLGLTVILLGDTAYIEIGGVKVSGQLKDINDIMDAVLPNLPDPIRPYIIKMTEIMMGIVPSDDELTTDGKTDIAKTVDTVLAMLTELSIDGDTIVVGISRGALSASLRIAPDLSYVNGDVSLTFNDIGGPFGNSYTMAFGIDLQRISACSVAIPTVTAAEYVKASDILAAVDCVLPLVKQHAFDLGITATVFGQTVNGDLYIDLADYTTDTIAAKVTFDVAGTPVTVTLLNKTLYIDINNGSIRLAQPLTKAAIKDLLAQIEEALPELGLSDKLRSALDSASADISISDLLNNISLFPTQNGFALTAAFGEATVNVDIEIADGVLCAINVNCNIDDKQVTIGLAVQTADGVLCGIQTTQATVMGVDLGLGLTIALTDERDITPDGEYILLSEFIPYISPVKALIERATSANAVTVDLSDMTIEVMGKQMTVSGKVDLTLDPVGVRATLTLFADSDTDKVDLTVIYADSMLYINVGKISLKFDIDSDMSKLNAAIAPYLPKSLKNLGDLGALSPIFAIIDNVGKITGAKDATTVMSLLFDNDNAYGKSMVRLVADMIMLFKRGTDDCIAAGITVMETPFAVTLNVQPIIDGDYLDFRLDAAVSNILTLSLTAKLDFTDEQFTVAAPKDGNYTPIVNFVTTVINGVNTLTAKVPDAVTTDRDGNTTTVSQTAFEVDSFTFDYDIFQTKTTIDENGETVEVKDEAGRAEIAKDEAGNKIKEKTIQLSNIDGQKALRFGLTTTTVDYADGKQSKSTKLAIEAHLKLNILDGDGNAQNGFPIELDLYVQPLDTEEKGLAYLYYREANGYGEKISIDYMSVLQMATAVLEILGADGETIDSLLKDYKLDIDTSVFEYMSIAGLDNISAMINNLAKAIDEAKAALSDAKAAWNRIQDAEDLDALIYEALNDTTKDGESATVKAYLDGSISHIKAAIALFETDDDQDETEEEENAQLNGALVGKVVNSVYFTSAESVLSAYVDNAIATGTEGWAVVSVTSADDKVNNIGVKNLDVNTAKLNTFNMQFAPVTSILTVTVPDDYTAEETKDDKVRYADLANLKHLIFDVMNTANMLEFDIGGGDTEDEIKLAINLAGREAINIAIKYSVKVKIIDCGNDENGNPIVKTAAAVELYFNNCTALGATVIPNCVTRLYFWDNVLYVQGVSDFGSEKNVTVGHSTSVYECKEWVTKTYFAPERDRGDYTTDTTKLNYVYTMYTVDELFFMLSNDIKTFLNQFLFYLVPLSKDFSIFGVDLQQTIADSIGESSSSGTNTDNTLAKIFKAYAYNNGKHTLRVGLKELVGSSALSDLTIAIIGANDGDDNNGKGNLLNNYISKLNLDTSIQNGLVTVNLDATLRNVKEQGNTIESKGLTPSSIATMQNSFDFDGHACNANPTYYDDTVIYTLDGIFGKNSDGTMYTSHTMVYNKATYVQKTREWISNFTAHPDYRGVKDSQCYDNFTHTLTKAYEAVYSPTYYIGVDGNGKEYVYADASSKTPIAVKSITDTVLAKVTTDEKGKITSVENRTGGIQWVRPWQAAYEAAQAAA